MEGKGDGGRGISGMFRRARENLRNPFRSKAQQPVTPPPGPTTEPSPIVHTPNPVTAEDIIGTRDSMRDIDEAADRLLEQQGEAVEPDESKTPLERFRNFLKGPFGQIALKTVGTDENQQQYFVAGELAQDATDEELSAVPENSELFVLYKGAAHGTTIGHDRIYFGLSANRNNPDKFVTVAVADIRGNSVYFTKRGRPYFKQGEITTTSEDETLTITKRPEGFKVLYELLNMKGDAISSPAKDGDTSRGSQVGAAFDSNGHLDKLEIHHQDISNLERARGFIGTQTGPSTLKDYEDIAATTGEFTVEGNRVTVVDDKDAGILKLTLFDSQGNEDKKCEVHKKIDIDRVIFETDADKLIENPEQPPNGIEGKSAGDKFWRSAPFSTLVGVTVMPSGAIAA